MRSVPSSRYHLFVCWVSLRLAGCQCRRQLTSECDIHVYCKWVKKLCAVVNISVSRADELQT